jgi:hypothetical protein
MKKVVLALAVFGFIALGKAARCQQYEVWPVAELHSPTQGHQYNGTTNGTVDVYVAASFYVAVNQGDPNWTYPFEGDFFISAAGSFSGGGQVDYTVETDNWGIGVSDEVPASYTAHVAVADGSHSKPAYATMSIDDAFDLSEISEVHRQDITFTVYGEG